MTVRMPSSGVFHVNVLLIVLYFLSAAGTIFDSHCLCRCMDKTQIVIKNSKYHYKKIETAVYLHTILTNVGSLVCHFNMITKRAFDLLFLRNIHILNTNQYYFVYIEYKQFTNRGEQDIQEQNKRKKSYFEKEIEKIRLRLN